MKLEIENDRQNGPGYALLKTNDSQIEPEGIKLRIETRDTKPFLGASGWQTSDTTIVPSAAYKDGSKLVISIGPDVVRHLGSTNYKVSLIGVDGISETGRVSSDNILKPRSNQSGPMAGASAVMQAQENAGGGSLDHVSAQQVPSDAISSSTTSDEESGDAGNGTVTDQAAEAPITDTGSKSGRKLSPAIIGVIALVVAAGAGYFAYSKFFASGDAIEASSPSQLKQAPAPSSSDEDLTPMEQARKFVAESPAAAAMVRRAKEFWADGHGEPGFLVMSRAAKGGDAMALLEMGKIYDPAHARSSIPGMPDAKGDIAYNYYRQALQRGSTDAEAAIGELQLWAEAAAGEGDRDANLLVRLIALEN